MAAEGAASQQLAKAVHGASHAHIAHLFMAPDLVKKEGPFNELARVADKTQQESALQGTRGDNPSPQPQHAIPTQDVRTNLPVGQSFRASEGTLQPLCLGPHRPWGPG